MALGVYDPEFKLAHALNIVRRYVDRAAKLDQHRGGIVYKQYRDNKVLLPAFWGDGKPIITKSGTHIHSLQFVKDHCFLSNEDAFKMVADLNGD